MNLTIQHFLLSTALAIITLSSFTPCCNAIEDKLVADRAFDFVRDLNIEKDDFEAMVVNGTEVDPGTYPWFTSIQYNKTHMCGGALISHDWVMTASHCIFNWGASLKKFGTVYVGALCKPLDGGESNCGQTGRKFRILEVIPHPKFSWGRYDNEIGLIRIRGGKRHEITPVAIDQGNIAAGYDGTTKNLWTPGFGGTAPSDDTRPDHLLHFESTYMTNADCKEKSEKYANRIADDMMCTVGMNNDGTCTGDSGGPLFDKDNDAVVGVVSWTDGGCFDGSTSYPGAYARVASSFEWIKKTVCANGAYSKRPDFCDPITPSVSPSPTSSSVPSTLPTSTGPCTNVNVMILPKEPTKEIVGQLQDNTKNFLFHTEEQLVPNKKFRYEACLPEQCDGTHPWYRFSIFNFNRNGLDGVFKVFVNGERVRGWSKDGSSFLFRDTVYINTCSTKTYCQDRSDFITPNTQKTCSDIADLPTEMREKLCSKNGVKKNCPVTCEADCQCFDAVEKFDLDESLETKCTKITKDDCHKNIIRSRCPVKCEVCTT